MMLHVNGPLYVNYTFIDLGMCIHNPYVLFMKAHKFICIYIYIYICESVCVHVCICVCVCIYIHTYIYIYIYIYIYTYIGYIIYKYSSYVYLSLQNRRTVIAKPPTPRHVDPNTYTSLS